MSDKMLEVIIKHPQSHNAAVRVREDGTPDTSDPHHNMWKIKLKKPEGTYGLDLTYAQYFYHQKPARL
jgi:hypothetical protein